MDYQYILFDLDGTLTNPGLGITNSLIYALNKYNITVEDRSQLYQFIGPPLSDTFLHHFGFSKEECKIAIGYFREYFEEKGILENYIYDGIEEMLYTLKKNNKILLVATSKPEAFAKRILEHFHISNYFSYIAGSNMDETRTNKDEVIDYALKSLNITQLSKVIMIGDRMHDILGAKKIGIDSLGVLYGYGEEAELKQAGADFIVPNVNDICSLLIK